MYNPVVNPKTFNPTTLDGKPIAVAELAPGNVGTPRSRVGNL